jgi:5-oxopent-3-ene-1,2,5-tricarboxylate decarboxylase / 2-hydroxyhepta-2,4-diene-1,7-dioate isomerase
MSGFEWTAEHQARLTALRDDLAKVSTATANHMLQQHGWRNTYMQGLHPLEEMGRGRSLVGRARTVRYLMRRGPEVRPADEEARAAWRALRRNSPEIALLESLEPGDIFCADALGLLSAGIIGDILTTRIQARGAVAAVIHGAVRDTPYIKAVGLPVFCAGQHPAASGRDLMAVDHDVPVNMACVQVLPGDILLADDEGVIGMPLELAEYVAGHGPAKEIMESWIRTKIEAGGSIHDYYPPTPEKAAEYFRETGRQVEY